MSIFPFEMSFLPQLPSQFQLSTLVETSKGVFSLASLLSTPILNHSPPFLTPDH